MAVQLPGSGKSNPRIIVIAGPTASGKTDFAIQLSKHLESEVISADSRQIYRQLDIGTGKPSGEQLSAVKHYMVSRIEPEKIMTADQFSNAAEKIMHTIHVSGKICLVVGGTGLWIRALIDGLASLPPADATFRKKMKQTAKNEGNAYLYAMLVKVDPESAIRLHPSDQLRVIRALEIQHLSGLPASKIKQQATTTENKSALWLGMDVPRDMLYQRAEQRIERWLDLGWLDEVRQLLGKGISPETPAMQALGYSHLIKHILGEYTYEKAVEFIKRDTRRYIKRQLTWFKAEKRMHWIDPATPPQAIERHFFCS
ncbi:tRNA (adenosine(37)-N6)-dimethylallyltransferase MiaA [bacterium]|nr:tRNA (adenosine(37)-N6)-dimethylallyltransferase MiaA [bacterium]